MSELPAAVAVVGVGLLGGRLARELVSSPTTPVLSLHSARPDRRRELESAFGKARRGAALQVRDRAEAPPEQTEVVVLTGAQDSQVAEARQHLERGRHVVTTVDAHSPAVSLLSLDPEARRCGRTVVVASCFSPGLSDVLAAWGEQRFDSVDEMHFARHGAGGPGCARDRLDALRREAHEWRDGAWVRNRPGSGRQLCWFPDPSRVATPTWPTPPSRCSRPGAPPTRPFDRPDRAQPKGQALAVPAEAPARASRGRRRRASG
ncbi:MAG: hypothetical protein R2716_01475 [Microthrixaceae bacterium]